MRRSAFFALGTNVAAPAPLDRIPLYVRGGSILPMGPDLQWSTEKPEDPMELRVYPGADGDFTIYEDHAIGHGREENHCCD